MKVSFIAFRVVRSCALALVLLPGMPVYAALV
ncbi:MAG: hypothetical protein ACI9GB_001322, partial [Halioglobus sp.]